jgi:hypothetical protein
VATAPATAMNTRALATPEHNRAEAQTGTEVVVAMAARLATWATSAARNAAAEVVVAGRTRASTAPSR